MQNGGRQQMLYGMRIYDLEPDSVTLYLKIVKEVALKTRHTYGIKLVGWYYTYVGPLNRIFHI